MPLCRNQLAVAVLATAKLCLRKNPVGIWRSYVYSKSGAIVANCPYRAGENML